MAGEFVHREDSKRLRKRKVMGVTRSSALNRLNSAQCAAKCAKYQPLGKTHLWKENQIFNTIVTIPTIGAATRHTG
jgi:hypothetical protein